MDSRESKALALFTEALNQPASKRDAWLRDACDHDDELLHVVQALVKADASASETIRTGGAPGFEPPMSLAPGTRLGPYEIGSPVGAGSMGEVYKATDTRLGRTVAIKVLPQRLAENPQFKRRFEREARAVSSLSHPNICALHDVGHEDGVDFMVMEYVEGETLAERLLDGALPLEQAVAIGLEIADALDKAHRRGVVHRDLKPANIITNRAGAKLLDFGIATHFRQGADASAGHEPGYHETSPPAEDGFTTRDGTIVGTPQYMAPEQIEGREVDARTDIFAFGAVLYEMVTGERAFTGETQEDLVNSILVDDSTPVDTLTPAASPMLGRLVERCLAKHPADRWQSARDLVFLLRWVRDGEELPPLEDALASPGRASMIWVAGLLLCAVLAALLGSLLTRPGPPQIKRFVTAADQLFVREGESVRITPDGGSIVFLGSVQPGTSQLFRRALDWPDPRAFPGTENALNLFVSPDSQWVGYALNPDTLKKVPLAGGPAVTICACRSVRGASWGRDGKIVYGSANSGLWSVSADGGEPERLTDPPPDVEHNRPHHLPDGRGILLTVWARGRGSVAVLPRGVATLCRSRSRSDRRR